MDLGKLKKFIELVQRQDAGDKTVRPLLQQLCPKLEDGYCLFNLHEQWSQAFAYVPGRKVALPPILTLAQKVLQRGNDDTLKMYSEPEWAALVALRGPVETVEMFECVKCRHEHPKMGTSGFLDAESLVCPSCGEVYFKSLYDKSPSPPCPCGAQFQPQLVASCPTCGSKELRKSRDMSPYEYFESHNFQRGPGA